MVVRKLVPVAVSRPQRPQAAPDYDSFQKLIREVGRSPVCSDFFCIFRKQNIIIPTRYAVMAGKRLIRQFLNQNTLCGMC